MPKKKLVILVVVVLVVIVGLVLIFGGGKYSSPKKTLNTLVKAMEKGDVDAFLDCFTEESQTLIQAGGEITSESIKGDVSDYKEADYKVTRETKDTAVMTSEKDEGVLVFKKEDGKWKIDLKATFEEIFKGFEQ